MYSPNDTIQIALIGAGGQGQSDAKVATSLPGVTLVAACDCYTGRLNHMKEVYGAGIFTTRDFNDIVTRQDIDAVIVATPDHWHAPITIACLNAGKNVYCEKPMVHRIEEGAGMIEAQNSSGKVLQIGSQYRSSQVYQKARELFAANAIGKLNSVEAWLDRNTAIGAWEYSIPTDASPATCDWNQFQGNAKKCTWDPKRFFRWRNYQDYGTGVAGDLFVHLLTGLHTVTNSLGPTRVYATGGTRYWKDGRDVPDVMLATLDYPETDQHPAFNVMLRVNFKSGLPQESFGVKFIGSDGVMSTGYDGIRIEKSPVDKTPDYANGTFAAAQRDQLRADYLSDNPDAGSNVAEKDVQVFDMSVSQMLLEHHKNFYRSIRDGRPSVEDGVFGLRAAGPALLTNASLFERKIVYWDPQQMKRSEKAVEATA